MGRGDGGGGGVRMGHMRWQGGGGIGLEGGKGGLQRHRYLVLS